MRQNKKTISLTGGVGSGKSAVLKILEQEYKADIIIADEVAHRLMEPGKEGYRQVVALLGPACLREDKSIDRKKMADLLFAQKENVERVNHIIHPMAWKAIEDRISAAESRLVVVEAALFDEEHNAMFDEIWYVYTQVETKIKRLMASRSYTREKCLDIMQNQATEAEFRALADYVIDNNGSVDEIRTQLKNILKEG